MRFSVIKKVLFFLGVLAVVNAWAADAVWQPLEHTAEIAATARDWAKARLYYKKSLREAVRLSDQSAVRHLKKQLLRVPVDPAVIARLLETERYDEAFKRLKDYLNFNPGDVWAMSLLGVVYEAIGKDSQAERLYKKAVSIQPDHPTPHYYFGRFLLLKKKKFEQALAELKKFRECLSVAAGKSSALEQRALMREMIQATRWIASIEDTVLKDPDEAFRELSLLTRVSASDAEVWYDYGALALRLGRKQTAYQAFKKVIALAPNSEIAEYARTAIDIVRNTGAGGSPYADPYS